MEKRWNRVYLFLLMNSVFMSLLFYTSISTFFMQSKGLNLTQIFALESVLAIVLFLCDIPASIWADQINRKYVLIIGNGLAVAGAFTMAMASDYWHFILSFTLDGISIAMLSGVQSAYVYDELVKSGRDQDATRIYSRFHIATTLAALVAPIIGSYIASTQMDYALPIWISAFALTIGWIFTFFLPSQFPAKLEQAEEGESMTATGWKILKKSAIHIWKTPSLIFFALSGPAVWVISNSIHYLNQILFKRLDVAVTYFGLIMAIATLISLLGSWGAEYSQRKLGSIRSILLCSVLLAGSFFAMVWIHNVVLLTIAIGVLLGSVALRAPIMSSASNALVPSEIRATTLSLLTLIGTLFTVLLNPAIGYMSDLNINYALLFCGVTILVLTFAYYPKLRKIGLGEERESEESKVESA
ncbi:MFS family permease [Croceifilum oryzae]|uniref:MFS family permease n=1 Tax=Croceifilum oryzae TaxID=1553429 RepID=A0AAJ1WR15_9BACL|nr:MFS transporter [Croceifilum oryzae]MDQ0416065.1 MFS family permease [Croceifilum oryzae]